MTDPTPDKVTAYLAEALADSRSLAQINAPSWSTMPRIRRVTGRHDRLLAAVERLLKLADEWKATSVQLGEMAERASARGADPLRTTLMDARAQAHRDNAQTLREAISGALLGETDA